MSLALRPHYNKRGQRPWINSVWEKELEWDSDITMYQIGTWTSM